MPTTPNTASTLTVLHTSDWHLGRRLYGQPRYDEFAQFLDWLLACLHTEQVDILLIAGDVFDTMTPSNQAQNLYYQFLGRVANSPCQHVVIVAGNHDSPSLLDAPKQVLQFLNVHVIGTACTDVADEVLLLTDQNTTGNSGKAQAVIMAVPYLRDKDVRSASAGESAADKDSQYVAGIHQHYQQTAQIAIDIRQQVAEQQHRHIPIIATGHLFAAGGRTTADDGVRELYVGSLGKISAAIFDDAIDYVALGHLHVPQMVDKQPHIRYSGSPIAMGFGEAKQQKQVCKICFTLNDTDDNRHDSGMDATTNTTLQVSSIDVPCFQRLAQIRGDMVHIQQQLDALIATDESIWLEVVYDGSALVSDLRQKLLAMVADSPLSIIKIKDSRQYSRVLQQADSTESLQDLSPEEVFARCLQAHEIEDGDAEQLSHCHQLLLHELLHKDSHAS